MTRKYYSIRTGRNPNTKLPLNTLKALFNNLYKTFEGKNYFEEAFGGYENGLNYFPGYLGDNIDAYIFKVLRKDKLWPIPYYYENYSEDDLYDMIEFLYDFVSKPIRKAVGEAYFDGYDKKLGQIEYREEINSLLLDYKEGYELSPQGEILILGDSGLTYLLDAPLPIYDPDNVNNRVDRAVLKFRRAKSTMDERRDAIKELADVLEFMRDKAEKYLEEQDEKDIFKIANNYGLRHHRPTQKTKYDNAIWYSWIFYYYLATIHALVRIIQREEF